MTSPSSTVEVSMRASRAPVWLQCPRRAKAEERVEEPTTARLAKPVALEFGDRLHEAITGHIITRPARSIAFDSHTRTKAEMERQLRRGQVAVKKLLEDEGQVIEQSEVYREDTFFVNLPEGRTAHVRVTGHIDLVTRDVRTGADGRILLDLKTSRKRPWISWPQMAVYAALWKLRADGSELPFQVGVLWCPRDFCLDAMLMTQPGEEMAMEGRAIIHARAMAAINAHARPSREGCSVCKVEDCALRMS